MASTEILQLSHKPSTDIFEVRDKHSTESWSLELQTKATNIFALRLRNVPKSLLEDTDVVFLRFENEGPQYWNCGK